MGTPAANQNCSMGMVQAVTDVQQLVKQMLGHQSILTQVFVHTEKRIGFICKCIQGFSDADVLILLNVAYHVSLDSINYTLLACSFLAHKIQRVGTKKKHQARHVPRNPFQR